MKDSRDCALIESGSAWIEQYHKTMGTEAARPTPEGERIRMRAQLRDIVATRARTAEGLRMKARILSLLDGDDNALSLSLATDICFP